MEPEEAAQKELRIEKATPADAEEILALQRLAYRSEAEIYDDETIPPLTQSPAHLREDFKMDLFLKATTERRIIGSVKGRMQEGSCHIGRLMVHPQLRGKGIGTLLMQSIEAFFPHARRFELFTGHRSKKNIGLYQKLGYRIFRSEVVNDGLALVFMEKQGRECTPVTHIREER